MAGAAAMRRGEFEAEVRLQTAAKADGTRLCGCRARDSVCQPGQKWHRSLWGKRPFFSQQQLENWLRQEPQPMFAARQGLIGGGKRSKIGRTPLRSRKQAPDHLPMDV